VYYVRVCVCVCVCVCVHVCVYYEFIVFIRTIINMNL